MKKEDKDRPADEITKGRIKQRLKYFLDHVSRCTNCVQQYPLMRMDEPLEVTTDRFVSNCDIAKRLWIDVEVERGKLHLDRI